MSFSPSVWGGSVMMLKRPLMGMARSHPRRHRSHRGGLSFGDVWGHVKEGVKDVVPRLLPIARDVGLKLLRSKLGVGRRRRRRGGLSMTPSRLGSLVRSSMGMRRRHRRSKLGGYAAAPYVGFHSGGRKHRSHTGCARTVSFFGGTKRRHSRMGSARMIMGALRSRLRSHKGMRRRRTRTVGMRRHRRRVGMRRHRRRRVGRGPIGGLAGGVLGKLLGNLLPF